MTAAALMPTYGKADYLLKLTLDPNVYSVNPGGQITLSGFFTTADSLTFDYQWELLFGLLSTSPHLGIVAGSVLSSQDFNPSTGAYFEDTFGGGGYLGPTEVNGPTVTADSLLRTFIVPANTPPGVYDYSYGVDLFPPEGGSGYVLFDTSLVIDVVPAPEPTAIILIGCGIVMMAFRRRRIRSEKFNCLVQHGKAVNS